MRKIAVGSVNPVKIEAVRLAFKKVWPEKDWETEGVEVSSGVADQPMSDEETIEGAVNRAKAALEIIPEAEYGVGLEGGLQQVGNYWFDCGWVAVVSRQGDVGIGSSIKMITPPKMMEKISQGMELGLVIDEIFGTENSRQAEGHFGLMTKGVISRTKGYTDGVIAALVRFIQPEVF